MGGGVGWAVGGPCDYSVSHWSKSFVFPFFGGLLFNLEVCRDLALDLELDQGLTIKCLSLTNLTHVCSPQCLSVSTLCPLHTSEPGRSADQASQARPRGEQARGYHRKNAMSEK